MKEDFLHYVWQYQLFSTVNLKTTENLPLQIVKSGDLNSNSGPDFLNSVLYLDHQKWVGNIEIHLKSSDWYLHQHEKDNNYDAVILHVVYEDDTVVFMKNNKSLPTLVLQGKIDENIVSNYNQLLDKNKRWIACENEIQSVDKFILKNWLDRLYFERLEQKSTEIDNLLKASKNDFEAVLFKLLCKNFGLKVNAEAFLELANSITFSLIRKSWFEEETLTAILFGQAGFLDDELEESYYQKLKSTYEYVKHKHQLKSISKNKFQFFRMRPNNFPTIRIAQLAMLYYKNQNLFSKLMEIETQTDFYSLLSVEVNDFWKSHYTFQKVSKKSPKRITKSFIDLLLINTIIPLKFVWLKQKGIFKEEAILSLIQQIKPERNTIISKFSDLKVESNNAKDTQSLIQLKNRYCTPKKCLNCAIGNTLLRS